MQIVLLSIKCVNRSLMILFIVAIHLLPRPGVSKNGNNNSVILTLKHLKHHVNFHDRP